jgi:hypothetical protein
VKRDWQSLIDGCFGFGGVAFAGHSTDVDRAFELLKAARADGLGWEALENELMLYLGPRMDPQHGDGVRQILKAREYFKPWLPD